MIPRLRLLAVDAFRSLLTRKASALLLVILFGLLTAVSCSLQVRGESVVNGRVLPIDQETRAGLGVGIAFAGVHFLGLMLVLFVIIPALIAEIDRGLAAWVLVKPIRRETFVLGRLLGGFAFLLAFSAFVVVGLEILLGRYGGRLEAGALVGWLVLAALLASYLAWGLFFSLHFGAGFGGIIVLLLAAFGAVLDADPLTRTLLWRRAGESAGIIDVIVASIFGTADPPLVARVLYGLLYFVVPGSGNIHDLAVASTFGRALPIPEDALSLAVGCAGVPIALLLSLRALKAREF
jgi:ABC-type Na+ efflux pump permease subunit